MRLLWWCPGAACTPAGGGDWEEAQGEVQDRESISKWGSRARLYGRLEGESGAWDEQDLGPVPRAGGAREVKAFFGSLNVTGGDIKVKVFLVAIVNEAALGDGLSLFLFLYGGGGGCECT